MDFKEELKLRTDFVNEIIMKYLPKKDGFQKDVFSAMEYSVSAGGKRLRPVFMMETARMFGGYGKEVYPFMAAIEFIHTYSLVHDDLPAMDNDDYRRGKLTTHKKFGHAMGILAGDGLLNYAFEIMAKAALDSRNIERAVKAAAIIGEKSGAYGMLGGQVVDVSLTGQPVDDKTLKFIYEKKTSALIEASMMAGAVLAGADESYIKVVEKIARNVGLAFQIQDDILDITGDVKTLGKPVLSDEKNKKTTYVTIHGMEESKNTVARFSKEALELLEGLPYDSGFLGELIESLITREK